MQVQVSGKHVDVGDALRGRITDELLASIGKYFERGGDADVVVSKDGHSLCVDIRVTLASGQQLVSKASGGDAHAAFSSALDKIEKRIRRYKRRLKNHHIGPTPSDETAPYTVLRAPDEADEDDGYDVGEAENHAAPHGVVIAETTAPLRTLTVSMAVMQLDLTESQTVVFRNAAHGGLSVVYRRPDGNIGWVDPERAGQAAAAV